MSDAPPPFDPTKPFTTVAPPFDPSKPFTTTTHGEATPAAHPPSDDSYTGTILPIRKDASGLHLAVPEMIAAPVRGAAELGSRAFGSVEHAREPLKPDELATVVSTVGSPIAGMEERGALAPRLSPKTPAASTTINPERVALAKEAMDTFGIPITAPQIGGSTFQRVAESATGKLPLSGAQAHLTEVHNAFNRAVSRTFGEDAPQITPSVMSAAKKRIGGEMNRIEDSHPIDFNKPLPSGETVGDIVLRDLAQIEDAARGSLTDQEFWVVKRLLDGVLKNVTPENMIAGQTYGNLFHKGAPLASAANSSNPNIAYPASQVMEVFRNALQLSLPDEELLAYQQARFQYKNMKTIQPLVDKAPDGNISPTLLNGRVSSQFKSRAFETQFNPLDRLAKIGQAFLKEPPSSGTSERGSYYYLATKAGEAGGLLAAGQVFGAVPVLSGAAATLAVNRALASYLRRPAAARKAIERAESALQPTAPSETMGLSWQYPAGAMSAWGIAGGGQHGDQRFP